MAVCCCCEQERALGVRWRLADAMPDRRNPSRIGRTPYWRPPNLSVSAAMFWRISTRDEGGWTASFIIWHVPR